MKNKALTTIFATVLAAVLLALGFNAEQVSNILDQQPTSHPPITQPAGTTQAGSTDRSGSGSTTTDALRKWSKTTPSINLQHVFRGEINRKGKPVGYHSRPNGQDPPDARLVRVRSKANRAGVYTATIAIRDGSQWKEKFSSFFPDEMTRDEVIDAILSAYKQSRDRDRQPWRGPSGHGFDIQGYTLSRGDINTAFPVYER